MIEVKNRKQNGVTQVIMPEIKPFRGLRYTDKAGDISALVGTPSDLDADSLTAQPCSPFFSKTGTPLRQWLTDGRLKIDMDPAFYLYEQETAENGFIQKIKGFLVCVSLDALAEENTFAFSSDESLSGSVESALQRLKIIPCQSAPIQAYYRDETGSMQQRLDSLSKDTPRYTVPIGNTIHRLWIINDPVVIRASCADFTERPVSIPADSTPCGIQNQILYASALAYRNWKSSEGRDPADHGADHAMMLLIDAQRGETVDMPESDDAEPSSVLPQADAANKRFIPFAAGLVANLVDSPDSL